MLDALTLETFEQALHRAGAGIVNHWRPGLSDGEIDKLGQLHGLVLPEDVRRLWRWHDGCSLAAPPDANEIAPGRRFPPLAPVLSSYAEFAGSFHDLYGIDDRFIEPFTATPMIFFDCRGAIDAPAPVLVSHDFEEPMQTLSSIGDLFAVWTQFIDDGLWSVREDGMWDGNYIDRLTDEIVKLGVY
jgi:hypothetical protein